MLAGVDFDKLNDAMAESNARAGRDTRPPGTTLAVAAGLVGTRGPDSAPPLATTANLSVSVADGHRVGDLE